jgi:hypothetical protein
LLSRPTEAPAKPNVPKCRLLGIRFRTSATGDRSGHAGTNDALASAMKIQRSPFPTLVALAPFTLMLSGCEIIGNIFKAGIWVGVLAVFAVIALVVWGAKSLLR